MTKAEHAQRVLRTMKSAETALEAALKAHKLHHAAVAAAVAEHGEALGLPGEIVAQSVEPKPDEN